MSLIALSCTCASRISCSQAYELRDAGAVIHSHSLNAVMATILDPEASEFKVTHLEMIKVQIFLIPCKLKNV